MSNPFAAFSIQIGSSGVQAGLPAADSKGAVREHALALKKARAAVSRRSTSCQATVVAGRERARRLPVPDGGPGAGPPRRVHARRAERTMSPRSSWSACSTVRPSSESGRRTPGFQL